MHSGGFRWRWPGIRSRIQIRRVGLGTLCFHRLSPNPVLDFEHDFSSKVALRLHDGQRPQVGGDIGQRCLRHLHRQHVPAGRWPFTAGDLHLGARVVACSHRFRRDQENEQLAVFNGAADAIVEAGPCPQVLAVEKHLVPHGLKTTAQVVGDGTILRSIGQENLQTGAASQTEVNRIYQAQYSQVMTEQPARPVL